MIKNIINRYTPSQPSPQGEGAKGLPLRGDIEGCNIWFLIIKSIMTKNEYSKLFTKHT